MPDGGWGVDGGGRSRGRRRRPEVSVTGWFKGQMRRGETEERHSLKVVAFSNQSCLTPLHVGMLVFLCGHCYLRDR